MNFLKQLKKEVHTLNLTDKLEIAYFIYRRTGEFFDYDPLYVYGTRKEKQQIIKKKVNIRNIKKREILCYSWAHMYAKLLNAFGITAMVTNIMEEHYYVIFWINNVKFSADLAFGYGTDIYAIKFGLPLHKFNSSSRKINEEILQKEQTTYRNKTSIAEVLNLIKEELTNKKIIDKDTQEERNLTEEEYIYESMKAIETIINFPRPNIRFMSGTEFIYIIMNSFLNTSSTAYSTQFFNTQKEIYIEVYSIIIGDKIHYFAYQEMKNGYYEFHEVARKYIEELLMNYSTKNEHNLKFT